MRRTHYFKKYLGKKRRAQILRSHFFWSFGLFLAAFLVIFYLICFYCLFQIEEIQIEGNQKVKTKSIKNLVEIYLPKKVIFWESRSLFLIDLNRIKKEILSSFPQIGETTLQRKFPDKLIISIKERKPIGVVKGNGIYFFVDKEGIIFEKTDKKNELPEIIPLPGEYRWRKGEKIIKERLISRVVKIEEELEKKEIQIRSIEIVNNERANVLTREGWKIYFNLNDDISQQVFNLDLLLKEKIPPQKRKNLEYIDLRFGNQIFYK